MASPSVTADLEFARVPQEGELGSVRPAKMAFAAPTATWVTRLVPPETAKSHVSAPGIRGQGLNKELAWSSTLRPQGLLC